MAGTGGRGGFVRREIKKDLLKLRDLVIFLEILRAKYGIDAYLKFRYPQRPTFFGEFFQKSEKR